MSSFWPNTNYIFENNRCFYCGETRSVKYFMKSDNGDVVNVCNKCVLKESGKNDSKKID